MVDTDEVVRERAAAAFAVVVGSAMVRSNGNGCVHEAQACALVFGKGNTHSTWSFLAQQLRVVGVHDRVRIGVRFRLTDCL